MISFIINSFNSVIVYLHNEYAEAYIRLASHV